MLDQPLEVRRRDGRGQAVMPRQFRPEAGCGQECRDLAAGGVAAQYDPRSVAALAVNVLPHPGKRGVASARTWAIWKHGAFR